MPPTGVNASVGCVKHAVHASQLNLNLAILVYFFEIIFLQRNLLFKKLRTRLEKIQDEEMLI